MSTLGERMQSGGIGVSSPSEHLKDHVVEIEEIIMNEIVYKTEVKDGKVRIPVTFLEKAKEKQLAVEVVTPEGSTYITPFDFGIDDMDDIPYQVLDFDFKLVESSLTPWEQQILTKIHHNWFNIIRDQIQEDVFKPVLQKINEDRKAHKVYPAREEMLKPFSFDPDGIRVIFVGKTPKQSEVGLWDLDYQKTLYEKGIWWINAHITEMEDLPFSHNEWEPLVRAAVKGVNRPVIITDKSLLPFEGATMQIDFNINNLQKLYELL